MRIQIRTGESALSIPLPSALVLNRLTAGLMVKALEQNGLYLSHVQAEKLIDCIRVYRKAHPEWVLVEVCGHEGEHIVVKL